MKTRSPALIAAVVSTALFVPSFALADGDFVETDIRLPFLLEVEAALRGGELDLADAIELRELAVKDPAALPGKWRSRLAEEPVPAWAATATLIENQQWRVRFGLEKIAKTRADYSFPPELEFFLDSALFPVRVYYSSSAQEALAQSILAAADHSWQTEILEWGFLAPPLVAPEGRYRIYVGETGFGQGGYMSPFAIYPDVEWDACVSFVLIDQSCAPGDVGPVVAHELNHAMQGAMDCLEHVAFWENTAVFIMEPTYPDQGFGWQNGFLPYFQATPYRSVCGADTTMESSEFSYMYGAFLWPHFLAYRFEDEANAPILVRRIWEGAMQDDGFNSVDYMESIDTLLRGEYDSDLDEAFLEFTVARFFLGDRAGAALATIEDAALYWQNPAVEGTIDVGDTHEVAPKDSTAPEPYGVSYWRLEHPPGFDREVTISLEPDAGGEWVLALFATDDSQVLQAESTGGEAAVISYAPTPGEERFLAVARMGGDGFDPGSIPEGEGFLLTVGPTSPNPSITGATPSSLVQGESVEIELSGSSFLDGASFEASPSGIAVDSVSFVDAETLLVSVTVDADAPIGRYTATVSNPDGGEDVYYSLLSVADAATEEAGDAAADDGCSCSVFADTFGHGGLLALFAALLR